METAVAPTPLPIQQFAGVRPIAPYEWTTGECASVEQEVGAWGRLRVHPDVADVFRRAALLTEYELCSTVVLGVVDAAHNSRLEHTGRVRVQA